MSRLIDRTSVMRGIMIAASVLIASGRHTSLQAQQPHEAFWSGFAPGGAGSGGFAEGFGYPFYLRFGGTLNQRVLLGIELYSVIWDIDLCFSFSCSSSPTRLSSNLTAIALLYPSPNGGLFMKPGVGISAGSETGAGTTVRFGSTLGVGYDLRLRENFYLTPNVDVLVLTDPRGPLTDTRLGYFFTLGFTWH